MEVHIDIIMSLCFACEIMKIKRRPNLQLIFAMESLRSIAAITAVLGKSHEAHVATVVEIIYIFQRSSSVPKKNFLKPIYVLGNTFIVSI